jgi:4-amino-4-deoxy-L-arabinose transferase-like glycosyltransferase
MNTDKPPVNEPSVLDYLKSRLRFWENGEKIRIPAESETVESKAVQQVKPQRSEKTEAAPQARSHWPWRSLIALVLALLGQYSWEPSPTRAAGIGLIMYGLSAAMLIYATLSREWSLSPLPENSSRTDIPKVRLLPLLVGVALALLAFYEFGNNMFTGINVTLWVGAMAFIVSALWVRKPGSQPGESDGNTPVQDKSIWERLMNFLRRDSWTLKATRWTLLILVVVAVVIFFRLYNITGVPSEPFSDHAEKILDVYDVSQGRTHIFFPRNTGREAIQMYLTLVVSWIFGTGLSFLSLKLGTVICGLATLPYMYLLGKEIGGKRLGLLAVFFAGIAYWPNVISRVGLRFPLYPLFVAPTLFYLLRGLRRRESNDFIIAGLFLGLGLHGYSPFRIVPFVVVIGFGLYWLHKQSQGSRKQALTWLTLLTLVSVIVFLPLARYWLDNPSEFTIRAISRITGSEVPLVAPAWKILLGNTWNALKMFNWSDGQIWVHSVQFRPALDVISGALFIIGIILLLVRYIRQRNWVDLFLLLSIPLLQLPSILSLAYPAENPALNRTAGALVPVFIIVAVALDGLLEGISRRMNRLPAAILSWVVILFLGLTASLQNYDLVFRQYATAYTAGSWNTSEMGSVLKQFGETYGTTNNVWIVPYPYWVDTRLPGVWAGIPDRDFVLWPQDFESTLDYPGTKLIMLNKKDIDDVQALQSLYPQGVLSTYHSATQVEGKDFFIFFIPPEE